MQNKTFYFLKQAVSQVGIASRAKILAKLREKMSETFEIQTLGRLRRMLNAKHYGHIIYIVLIYIHTLDENIN